jgi:hypothetical protein
MKSRLEQKIDSEEQWTADYELANLLEHPSYRNARINHPNLGEMGSLHWWLKREYLRIQLGVYASSEITESINRSFGIQYALHISKEDKDMVAYTPSYEAGCADKQIKTTIGKFLRKHFFLLTDAHIQTLESDHRAEINAAYKVATTSADIRQVYTTMDGDSGCMRKLPIHYGIENDVHPSEAYEAPGMGVAYTERDGVIKSRSVIWVNPIDAKDKRFVRIYGDPVLRKLLIRDGFVQTHLAGAKLKKIPYVGRGDDPRGYLSPYLDGPGGAQSDPNCYVALDGEWLTIIGREAADKLNRAASTVGANYAAQSKSYENARVILDPVPNMDFVSDMTGKTYSMLRDTKVRYYSDEGEYKTAELEELPTTGVRYYVRYTMESPRAPMTLAYAKSTTASFFHNRDSRTYIDTQVNRDDLGYQRLSTKYYTSGELACGGATVKDAEGVEHYVNHIDLMDVIDADGDLTQMHATEFTAMRKQGYIRCSPLNEGRESAIHKSSTDLGRSAGGTVFSKSRTERFVPLFTGEWVRTVETTMKNIFNVRFRVLKPMANRRPTAEMLTYAFEKSSYANTIKELTAGIAGATSSSLVAVTRVVEANIVTAIYRGYGEELFTVADPAASNPIKSHYSPIPYADVMRGIAGIKRLPSKDTAECGLSIEAYAGYLTTCEVVLNAFAPLQATLKVMVEQTAAEEAGQRRLVDDALDAELDNLSA